MNLLFYVILSVITNVNNSFEVSSMDKVDESGSDIEVMRRTWYELLQ